MRSGVTLLELLVVLAVTAIAAGAALPALFGVRDRLTVRLALADATRALGEARAMAQTASQRLSVLIDADSAMLVVVNETARDTLRTVRLAEYGVRLRSTRSSISFGPTGLGWGAATATITLSRGRASAALAVSRLGRVRRV